MHETSILLLHVGQRHAVQIPVKDYSQAWHSGRRAMDLNMPCLNFFPNHYPSSSIIINLRKPKIHVQYFRLNLKIHPMVTSYPSLSKRWASLTFRGPEIGLDVARMECWSQVDQAAFFSHRHTILQGANYDFQGVVTSWDSWHLWEGWNFDVFEIT